MSHQDPYVSTETLRQLCQPTSATRPEPAPPLDNRETVAPELDSIKIDAKRVGMLLVRIPFLDMMFFFVRVFFALFFATLVYLFLWWLLIAASAGAGFSLLHVLARLMQLPGY